MRQTVLPIASLVFGTLLVIGTYGQSLKQQTCSRAGREAIIQDGADAYIAGFFAMHDSDKNGVGCGGILSGEVQAYEAIRWALDRLNKKGEVLNGEFLNDYYIPGVRIGMMARDYCGSAANAVSMASEMFPQLSTSDRECQPADALMLGMIGGSTSDDTRVLQGFAKDHSLPLVSYTSTAPILSDTDMFPNLMRTIPPDGPLTQTITKFAGEINWDYVVVVYTDNTYGQGAYRAIRPQLVAAGICLTAAIPMDPLDDSDEAIEGALKKVLQTNTVGVIYLGNARLINAFLKKGEDDIEAGKLQWVVTDSISVANKFPGQKYPRGIVSVLPLGRKIIEFEDHWVRINNTAPSPENPWYADVYMEMNQCRLPGYDSRFTTVCDQRTETQRRNAFVQDQFVEPAVHAVFIYANALKRAHQTVCGGNPGMCNALRKMTTAYFYENYMRDIDFVYGKAERVESLASFSLDPYNTAAHVKFQGNDIINPAFEIFNFNDYPYGDAYRFQSIGTHINNLLELISTRMRYYDAPRTARLDYIPKSECPSLPCSPCLGDIVDPKYVYIPGDLVLNAVFSVHEQGATPLSCGDFIEEPYQGIQAMEAFIYAVNYVNSQLIPGSRILQGIKLGALGFDDCSSPYLSNQLLSSVQRYAWKITDNNGQNALEPNTVEAFIGGRDEFAARSMAGLMNTYKRPMVGVETWSQVLNDAMMFPYFMRSHYDFEYVAKAMVNVAKRMGWKYLQSVYPGGMTGTEANNILRKVAAEEGICIIASYDITMGADDVVKNLLERPNVKPVVVLLQYNDFRKFMQGVKTANAAGKMQLISFNGDSKKTIQGFEMEVDGMISIKMWAPSLRDYRNNHLDIIIPDQYTTNPWMKEWFESVYDCSFNPSGSQTQCTPATMFRDEDNFELNTDVINVIYGVRSIALALDATLKHYCGDNYNGICGNFLTAADKGEILRQKIAAVNFFEEENTYMFSERMGNIPYKYFNYQYNEDTPFKPVGDYKPASDLLYLEGFKLTGGMAAEQVSASCEGICMECLYLFRYQKYLYVPGDILIPGIFDVHNRGDTPYSCSDLRHVNGFQYTEAFRYALERINSGQGDVKLNGVTLGGIGFDGCTDPIRASAIVTGIYSGALPRPDTSLAESNLEMADLMGWLSYDSASTISVSKILQRFGIPIVSPGATSPVLDDKDAFKTFFRTIPSESRVAEAMAKLSNYLGFDYIITVNAPEDGSREAVWEFRKYAKALGICIGASYEFETDGNAGQIMNYILQSTTKVVAVFSPPDSNIEDLLDQKNINVNAADIIFIANNPWTIPVQGKSAPVGTINFMSEGAYDLESFRLFLENQIPSMTHPNPWLKEFYESFYQCNLAGTYKYDNACRNPTTKKIAKDLIMQDIWVIPTMNAVYSLAEGIHRTLQEKCGANYTGICSSFISDMDTYDVIMDKMDVESFQDVTDMLFKFIEREADRKLVFKRFMASTDEAEIGTYDDELDIPLGESVKLLYEDVQAQCIGQCAQCQDESTREQEFMYESGDLTIGALFDVHKMGSTHYTCGDINPVNGFQLVEAFTWALKYVNDKKGIFKGTLSGVKLGSLIFDTCSSPVRAGNLIANYHARNFEINTTNYRIDPTMIDLYIGPMLSESSIRVADILGELGIPQISYGSSSLELRKYRYFARTVPADDKQARALISFLKKYELHNIQVVSQFSSVGEYGRDEFMRLAPLNRICVSAEYEIGQTGSVNEDEVREVMANLNNVPGAKVVVVIMDNPYAFLRVANQYNFSTEYAFIGTDKWGFGIAGYENLAGLDRLVQNRRVVTLDVETADYPDLDLYLEEKVPSNYMSNPWFKEYYEHAHNCSLSTPPSKYPRSCNQYDLGYSTAESYIQDPYALYVINAVFSTALGIHKTLQQWCGGEQYYGLCNILRTNGERRDLFFNNIKQVMYYDQTKQPFYYTPEGESDRGFHLYEPQSNGMSLHGGTNGYYWEDIGSYNDSHYLKMDVRYRPDWTSTCDLPGSCMCDFPAYQPSRYMSLPSSQDLNIVFVSNIHKKDPNNNMACGAIDTGSQFQNLLAFIYAIQLVNQNKDSRFPPSLQLGGIALDTCSTPSRIGEDVYSLMSGEPVCGEKDGEQVVPPSSVVSFMVRNSQNSIAVSSMLSPLKVTSISMSATAAELSDKLEHAYFLRTVPPDNIQALVVSQILQHFGWDYATIVFAENSYGRSAVETLLGQSDRNSPKFCFGRAVSMPLDTTLDGAKGIIDELNQQIGAQVVVVFVTNSQVRLLLQAASEKGLNNRFIWIGSDTWANNALLTQDYEETATGAVTIQIRSEYSEGFKNFFKSLNLTNRQGIPNDWFDDMYQTVFSCRILDSEIPKSYTRICTGEEEFTDSMISQDPYVLHTMISVFQIAEGLSQVEDCKQTGLTISSCLSLLKNRKQAIYNSILNAQQNVLSDDLGENSFTFKFTSEGYGDIGYNIYNFRRDALSSQFGYMKIGTSTGEDLSIDTRKYEGHSFTDRALPLSRCPIGSSCRCVDNTDQTFIYSRQDTGYIITNEGEYVDPVTGQLVTIEDSPESGDRFRDIWALIVATLAGLGAFAAFCMFIYLLVVYPVRGGTTILGYMLSFGIILMYVLVFAFIVHASEEICAIRRFCLGFIYAICYSAMFVKLVDCWRTKDKEDIYMVKYNKIGNPWGLFFSAILLVLVQVMINAEWLILEEPDMDRVIYKNMLWPRCLPDDFYDEGLVLSTVYVMILIGLSVLIGLCAFGNDKNHYDCRWLVGCVVLTIPCWMVWCLVACLGEYKMRDAAVAIGLLYNATVMLMCGPMRKLYLLHKYQHRLNEAERQSQLALSQRDYSAYGNQYDNAPHMQDTDSLRDSVANDDVFMHEPK